MSAVRLHGALAAVLLIALGVFYWVMLSNNSAGAGTTDSDSEEELEKVTDDEPIDATTVPIADALVPVGSNMLKNGDAEAGNTSGWKGFASTVPKPHEGAYAFVLESRFYAYTSEMFPLDPKASYELSGFFTSEGGPGMVYLGFDCYDANKKRITSREVTPIPRTETELVQAVKKGDKVLKIKDGSTWKFDKRWTPLYGVVAFDVDPSGKYADLPNRKISLRGITEIRQVDGQWEVTLKKPMLESYPAGTKVRQQRSSGAMKWVVWKYLKENWVGITGKASGISSGGQKQNMFYPGTRYFRVVILNLSQSKKPPAPKVLADDVILRVTK